MLLLGALMAALGAQPALVSASSPILQAPLASEVAAAREEALPAVDPSFDPAATNDLDREEAIDLVEGLFRPLLEGPSGIFDDLAVERFLSDYVAVLPAGAEPTAPGSDDGYWAGRVGRGERVLLDSTVPLRTEAQDGEAEAVDLDLKNQAGGLRPVNPIADVVLPRALGEGISLPDAAISIRLRGAPDRAPTVIDGNVAFYPNVSEDSDFLAAPTPVGVETFMTIRSHDASPVHEYELELPDGAELRATEDGGAEVVRDAAVILKVRPPLAVDAAGSHVPVGLTVDGNRLRIEAQLTPGVELPVMVDPTFEESYNFLGGTSGWIPHKDPANAPVNSYSSPGRICVLSACALTLDANVGAYGQNALTLWNYVVPRFSQDATAGKVPTSYIKSALVNFTYGQEGSDWAASPGALLALSNEAGVWQAANLYPPNQSGSWGYDMGSSKAAKMLGVALFAHEPRTTTKWRYLWMTGAQVVVGDNDAPSGSASGPGWVNQTAKPISLDLTDSGLGMKSVQVTASSLMPGGVPASWKAALACTGGVKDPCPREWKTGNGGIPALPYDPSAMPQGINELTVRAADPLNNGATTKVNVKVDHSAPSVSLGGTITEQVQLGVTRPRYSVKVTAADGSPQAPQAGVEKVTVKVDGGLIDVVPSGCGEDSCGASPTVYVNSAGLASGSHLLEVTATDRAGNVSTPVVKSFEVQPDVAVPSLTVLGGLKNAAGSWLLQTQNPSFTMTASDSGAGVEKLQLLIDGQVKLESVSTSCPDGGCSLTKITSYSVAGLSLGKHQGEVKATDFGGRVSSQNWSFSVSATGTITAAQAATVANASEPGTGEESSLSELGELTYEPGLEESEEEGDESFEITGAGLEGRISEEPSAGIVVEPPSGLPFLLTPVGGTSEALNVSPVANGDAISYANLKPDTDLISRPIRDGVANYLQFRAASALAPFSWKVVAADPFTLSARPDGGVNVTIDPAVEVPPSDGLGGELTDEPQLVASFPKPKLDDGKGNSIAASWSISGDVITLTPEVTGTPVFPVLAEVLVRAYGPLRAWMPEGGVVGEPPGPNLLSAVGVTEEEEPYPSQGAAYPNPEGTELGLFLPDENGEMEGVATQVTPVPGTEVGPVQIAAPVGEYAPVNSQPLALPGFYAGGVVCGTGGPDRPAKAASLVIQYYGWVRCQLVGDQPPKYGGAKHATCLQYRISLLGAPAWTYAKCNNSAISAPRVNWNVTQAVTDKCSDEVVYRGLNSAGPIYNGRAILAESISGANTRC